MNTNKRIDEVLIGDVTNEIEDSLNKGHEVMPGEQGCRSIWTLLVNERVHLHLCLFVFIRGSSFLEIG